MPDENRLSAFTLEELRLLLCALWKETTWDGGCPLMDEVETEIEARIGRYV